MKRNPTLKFKQNSQWKLCGQPCVCPIEYACHVDVDKMAASLNQEMLHVGRPMVGRSVT